MEKWKTGIRTYLKYLRHGYFSIFFSHSFASVNFCNLTYSSSQTENGHSVLKSDYK